MTPAMQVTIKQREPSTVAYLTRKGPYSQIGEAFGKLYAWIGQKGYVPSGPPEGVYFNAPGQVQEGELLWELRSPIGGKIAESKPDSEGAGVKKLTTQTMACTTHKGSYEGIGKVYEALTAWVKQNGCEMTGPTEEVYLTNPQETPPDQLVTEVRFPVRKK